MGVRITSEEDRVALFDSVTNTAFGPVFENADDAQSFLDFYERQGFDTDLRKLSEAEVLTFYHIWESAAKEEE